MADNKTGFATVEAATIAALNEAASNGNRQERIGIVYEKDGRFFFTPPQNTSLRDNGSRTKATIQIPEGGARMIYHNHPPGDDNDRFSPDDIRVAETLGIPSAIIFGQEPTMRVFRPGETDVERERRHGRGLASTRYSSGDPFPAQPLESPDKRNKIAKALKGR